MNYIDLFDSDMLISDLIDGQIYLVGDKTSKRLYFCRRDGFYLYITDFKFNLTHSLAMRVDNNIRVYGFDKKENIFVNYLFKFNSCTIKELVYSLLPCFVEVDRGAGYVRDLIPAEKLVAKEGIL